MGFISCNENEEYPNNGYIVMMKNTTQQGYGRVGIHTVFTDLQSCYEYKQTLIEAEYKVCVNIVDISQYKNLIYWKLEI